MILRFTLTEWAKYQTQLGPRLFSAGKRGLVSAAARSIPILQGRTRTAPPANPGGVGIGGAVDIGSFLGAWRSQLIEGGAEVRNDAPYSAVIEGGRRAGAAMPPRKVMAEWAQRRLGLSAAEAKRIAFVLARAIARRGLKPRKILKDAIPAIRTAAREEMDREIQRELSSK